MLGAEGVKSLVIGRLQQAMPTAMAVRRAVVGCDVVELPEVQAYYPAPRVDVATGGYPFCMVYATDTPGEIANKATGGDGDNEHVFQMEYNLVVELTAWSAIPGDGGVYASRLQAERLALAARECLLADRMLMPSQGAGKDHATVNYDRWVEDYDTYADETAGGWIGAAQLKVPVLAFEYLDRTPYLDNRRYVLTEMSTEQHDPITGAVYPDTRTHDRYPVPDTFPTVHP